jgi:stage III sporulation protein AB
MTKWIGAILIIGISSLTGFFYAQKFTDRCYILKLWLRIIDIFQTEIYFEARRLPEVFRRAASLLQDRRFSNAFIKLMQSLEFGTDGDFKTAWGLFLVETGEGVLVKEDFLVLYDLGNYLGSTDRLDQLAKLKTCHASLTLNLQSAEHDRNKQTRIYRYLGFAIGAITVLWLI